MRNLIVFNMVTVDGFYAGPNGEIDWHNVDNEFNDFAIEQTNSFGTLLFGRITYELMASYWPTEQSKTDDPKVATIMNSIPKIVFSKTLIKANWENTRLVKENIEQEIAKLKQEPGKDMAIFGSGKLIQSIADSNLIDEYRLLVNPLILGDGKKLFENFKKCNLELLGTKQFKSGNILLKYKTKR